MRRQTLKTFSWLLPLKSTEIFARSPETRSIGSSNWLNCLSDRSRDKHFVVKSDGGFGVVCFTTLA